MAYINTVALNLAGNLMSRTVTDMWRSGKARIAMKDLHARIASEVDGKVGDALPSTVAELRTAVMDELVALSELSGTVRIDSFGLATAPPTGENGQSTVRVIANKAEMHQFLVHLSTVLATRRKACKAA